MNTFATFFASIIALFSGLLGYVSTPTGAGNSTSINSSSTSFVATTSSMNVSRSDSAPSKEDIKKILFTTTKLEWHDYDAITIKKVVTDGLIEDGLLKGYTRVVVYAQSDNWSMPVDGYDNGDQMLLFATKDFKTYIHDGTPSQFPASVDIFTKNVIATGTIPLNHPETIIINSFVLSRSALYTDTVEKNAKTHQDVTGKIMHLERSKIVVEDSFGVKFSYYLLPKETYTAKQIALSSGEFMSRNYYFDISEIKTDMVLYKKYGTAFPGACGNGNGLQEISDVTTNDLTAIGTTVFGTVLYTPKDKASAFLKKEYASKVTVVTNSNHDGSGEEDFKSLNNGEDIPTFESYSEKNPVLFLQDPWGRWMAVGEWDYKLEGGCGKPVIYLYPKHDTKVSVKITVPATFSTQIPVYSNGWKVLARPDGSLTDLQPEVTNCNAIDYNKFGSEYAKNACSNGLYPYLYWSGNVMADYPKVSNGWIVQREDIRSFLEKKLTDIGFTVQERSDFVSYWVEEMLKKEEPYFRVSFITTEQMNNFIPMSVVPKPDSVYRLFMDWEPLLKNPSQHPQPQQLPSIRRDGFTLIEWGGLHFR